MLPQTPSPCDALRLQLGCDEGELVGESTIHERMLDQLVEVARFNVRVLLTGPTGVGKSTIAHALHRASGRRGVLVPVNAASLSSGLADSLLFGHAKGSFTDASAASEGLVAQANAGTLFIDEVADLEPAVQAKLLTFLDHGSFRGIGREERRADVRLITATNRPLAQLREDLRERIAQVTIDVPALADRPGDIEPLAEALLIRLVSSLGLPQPLRLAPDALAALALRPFPNNVRELENVLRRGALRAAHRGSRRILAEHISSDNQPLPQRWEARLELLRRASIEEALQESASTEGAAGWLGVGRETLYGWMRMLGMSRRDIPGVASGRRTLQRYPRGVYASTRRFPLMRLLGTLRTAARSRRPPGCGACRARP